MAKERVLVAMSGGIDSSITAMLLLEQGYEIIGVTIKTWDTSSYEKPDSRNGTSEDEINDARNLAVTLGFPHYVIDMQNEFSFVITNFVDEYLAGRTPNPCVVCNPKIKFGELMKKADQLGCNYVATGHYAQIRKENNRYILSKGVDERKDQSYFLWKLSQESLSRTLFPLGGFTKEEIKELAKERGFTKLANKPESYDICFMPNGDYRDFLRIYVDGISEKLDGGDIIDTSGKVLGKHKGYPFYTIGQRKGLEVATGVPMYVVEIKPDTNTVVLGERHELYKKSLRVRDYNLSKYEQIPENMKVETKIRYKNYGTPSTINVIDDTLKVNFEKAVPAIAPGQSAVFYEGNDLVGGGFIM